MKLEMQNIGKNFGKVQALKEVSLIAESGRILALMGENGAGKSTLMKILSGVIPYSEYEGIFSLNGKECRFHTTEEALNSGVAIIHQELNLFPEMSVAENIFMGREPTKSFLGFKTLASHKYLKQAEISLAEVNLKIDVRTPLKDLSIGTQQMIEIARALQSKAKVLIFDEPTSALNQRESETLFRIILNLRASGHTLLYISHRMEEVFRLADDIAVLRDGRSVGQGPATSFTQQKLIELMVGRPIEALYPVKREAVGEEVFRVENFSVKKKTVSSLVKNISFTVHSGEILGISGLMGAGRSELLLGLMGAYGGQATEGSMWLSGKKINIHSPAQAIAEGLLLATEDRKLSGLILCRNTEENLTLSALPRISKWGRVKERSSFSLVKEYANKLKIKVSNHFADVGTLSGGNQQKVVLSRCLACGPKVLFLDEPTRGIDVGARQEIYQLISELARSGLAIVLVSSDLPEVLGLSDRIMVMQGGENRGIVRASEATQESLMQLACA